MLIHPLRRTWVQPPFFPTRLSRAPCSNRARICPFGPARRFSPLAGVIETSNPSRVTAPVEAVYTHPSSVTAVQSPCVFPGVTVTPALTVASTVPAGSFRKEVDWLTRDWPTSRRRRDGDEQRREGRPDW